MNIKALRYVLKLTHAPNGEPITAIENHVLLLLAYHHNHKTGRLDPSASKLAEESRRDRRTVQRALQSLERKGVIRKQERPSGRGRALTSNAYLFPAEAQGWRQDAATGGGYTPPRVAAGRRQGGGPLTLEVGNEVETEKESPKSLSLQRPSADGAIPDEPLPSWADWIAEYTGHRAEGIRCAADGGYLATCAKNEAPPPCTLAELRAVIDLVRWCMTAYGAKSFTLPKPNADLEPLIASARAWRTASAAHPELATDAEAFKAALSPGDGKEDRYTAQDAANRCYRLMRHMERAQADQEAAARTAQMEREEQAELERQGVEPCRKCGKRTKRMDRHMEAAHPEDERPRRPLAGADAAERRTAGIKQ